MAARRAKRSLSKAQREFVCEAEETLERLRADLLTLAEQREGEREADPDLVNQLFRAAHSLKGLAGMVGFDAMSELAHHLEDALDGLRMGRIDLDSPAIPLIDEAVALAAGLLAHFGHQNEAQQRSDARDVADMLARIETGLDGPAKGPSEDAVDSLDLDPAMLRALTEYEEHRLRENIRKGRHVSLVETAFEISNFEEGLGELSAAIREVGEVVSTLPSPGDSPASQICFALLAATRIDASALAERLEFPDTSVRVLAEGRTTAARDAQASVPESGAALSGIGAGTEAARTKQRAATRASDDGEAPETPEFESLRSLSDTVRVDIRKLDELMVLVGELATQRASLSRTAARLLADAATSAAGRDLAKIDKLLGRKLQQLQAGVLDVRMVPLRQVFERLSRVVRRLQRDHGKQVRLDFRGADTELDKLIVEELVDPLVHLVRNAFDHAIETPEQRLAAHKPAEGAIHICASQRGNHVVIEVSDDGRGMDAEAIRVRARAAGLAGEADEISDKEALALVLEAGLSTCSEVSETSGRGVGMDVVRSNLTALGGLVDLASEPGRGTTVTLTLPVTLAIVQALLVAVGEECFAIPLNAVIETLLVEESQIHRSEGHEILDLRGEALPLRRLASEFGICAGEQAAYVVVLGLGDARMGLLVDRLEGQQDAVIKPIQGPIQQVRGIAGATELGDRGAVLVIDVASLVEDGVRRRDAA